MSTDRGSQPHLGDGAVLLRPWQPEDAPVVRDAFRDPELRRWIEGPTPFGLRQARTYVRRAAKRWQNDDGASFAIVDVATGQVVGSIALHGVIDQCAMFGYWLTPAGRGQGFATRALRLMCDWTLDTSDAVRLEAYTHVGNDASGRVLERAGFQREGVFRKWLRHYDELTDVVFYSRIRGE